MKKSNLSKALFLLLFVLLSFSSLSGCYTREQLDEAYQQGYKDAVTERQSATPSPTAVVRSAVDTSQSAKKTTDDIHDYILNTNSHKFHYPDCYSVEQMKEENL